MSGISYGLLVECCVYDFSAWMFAVTRMLRSSEFGKIVIQLGVSMIFLCGMVAGALFSSVGSGTCFAFAILVHFACLVLFMWMVVDAYSVHQRIDVFGGITSHFTWKATVACWGKLFSWSVRCSSKLCVGKFNKSY